MTEMSDLSYLQKPQKICTQISKMSTPLASLLWLFYFLINVIEFFNKVLMTISTLKTRKHSSRMRTGCSLTVCRSLLPEGVSAPGGCVCSRECLLLGGVCLGSGIPACTETDTSVWTESQMPIKTLPRPNFVEAGNNSVKVNSHRASLATLALLHQLEFIVTLGMHGLFSIFCRLFERFQRRFYAFTEEQCNSTTTASEPYIPAFKGVQPEPRGQSRTHPSQEIDFTVITSFNVPNVNS